MGKLLGQLYKKQSVLNGAGGFPSPTLEVEEDDSDTDTDSSTNVTTDDDNDYSSGSGDSDNTTSPSSDPVTDDDNGSDPEPDDDSDTVVPPPPPPSDCPGGCAPGYDCIDGACVEPNTGEEQRESVIERNGNGSGSGGGKTVTAEGQNVIKKAVEQLKKVDKKVWYAVGGTAALLLILNAN
jgi:hypothetical protein